MTTRLQSFTAASSLGPGDYVYISQSGIEKSLLGSVLIALLASYSTVATTFTQPAAGASISVQMTSTAWLAVGQLLYVATGGFYQVASITTGYVAVLTNLGYPGNASPGASINNLSGVVPGGLQGPNAITALTASFTQPAALSNVTVVVATNTWMAVGANIYVAGGGYYSVVSLSSTTGAMLQNLGVAGNASPTTVVPSASVVAPSGATGATGATGVNAYTTVTSSFVQPAAAGNVTVAVANSAWMTAGQNLYIGSGGFYALATINSGTSITVTNSGVAGNATPGATIPAASGISAAGASGATGLPSQTGNAGLALVTNGTSTAWGMSAGEAAGALAFLNM